MLKNKKGLASFFIRFIIYPIGYIKIDIDIK